MNAWWQPVQELSSPSTFILVGVLVCLTLLLIARRRRRAHTASWRHRPAGALTSQPFERGFDLLLDARWQEAADVLKDAVKTHLHRALEYLELGKLWRRQGDPGRAARMFEHLLARPGLESAVRLTAQYELALAYQALGWHEPAAATLEQLLGVDPAQAEARRALRGIHEEMGRWETAAALEMLRLKRGEAQDRRTLAALLTQQGKVAWAAGQLRASAAHLRSALKLDPDGAEAALYLGRTLLCQGKLQKAFQVWDDLAKVRPEWLFLAFRDMQAAFRQLHNEAGWGSFLRAFTERHPGDPTGYLALAEWYESRGQSEEAMPCLRQVLELDPGCREAHLALAALYRAQGIPPEVVESYERLASATALTPGGRFRCRACGHAGEELFWKCPSCRDWVTPERLLPQPRAMPILAADMTPQLRPASLSISAPIVVRRETPVPPPARA